MRSIRLIGFAMVTTLALAACGGGASPSPAATTASSAPAASSPAASSPAASAGAACESTTSAATVAVTIANNAFGTDPVQATVGDVIASTNEDAVPHTATLSDDSCGTDNLNQGQSGALAFSVAGTYPYYCEIHPTTMMGTIEVSG